jgi:excisionase family DNA binding protein
VNNYLSMAEAAELLGVSVSTVNRWRLAGLLRADDIGGVWVTTAKDVQAVGRPKMGRPKEPK